MKLLTILLSVRLLLISSYGYAQKGKFGKDLTRVRSSKKISVPVHSPASDARILVEKATPLVSAESLKVRQPSTVLRTDIRQPVIQPKKSLHPLLESVPAEVQKKLMKYWGELSATHREWNFKAYLDTKEGYLGHFRGKGDLLSVLSLEQYMMKHQGKWPRNFENMEDEELMRSVLQVSLDGPTSKYVVYLRKLRKQAVNVPSTEQIISQAQKFIAEKGRVPGAIYFMENIGDYSASVSEKTLGADLMFSVQTATEQELAANPALARLKEQWNCYVEIHYQREGGGVKGAEVPEIAPDGTPNIPVLTNAQWQERLNTFAHEQSVRYTLFGLRSYEELHQIYTDDFHTWPDMVKEEVFLFGVTVFSLKRPTVTKEEWDQATQRWVTMMGEPRVQILEPIGEDNLSFQGLSAENLRPKKFKDMSPFEQLEVVFGHIYHLKQYPEEFAKELREKGEIE